MQNDKVSNLIFYYLSSADDKYVKMKDTFCTPISDSFFEYVSFSSFTSAKNECSRNSSCKGVLDRGCDGNDYNFKRFYLCKIAHDYTDSEYGNCVYDKKGMIYFTCILFYAALVLLEIC